MIIKCLFLVSVLTLLAGCVTSDYQEVIKHDAFGGSTEYRVEVGGTVKVVTKNNEQFEFTVEEITDTGIAGPNVYVDFESMESLKVWKVDVDESVKKVSWVPSSHANFNWTRSYSFYRRALGLESVDTLKRCWILDPFPAPAAATKLAASLVLQVR